jgi:hypothetical protein
MKTIAFLYVFLFVCMFKMQATQPTPKSQAQQQPPKDCVKHPQIVKTTEKTTPKVVVEKTNGSHPSSRGGTSIPHFSVLNFINFFYSKDTLDNLRVM